MGALGVNVHVEDHNTFDFVNNPVRAALVQYPATDGAIFDYRELREKLTQTKSLLVCSADLLSLCLLTPPGNFFSSPYIILFGSHNSSNRRFWG